MRCWAGVLNHRGGVGGAATHRRTTLAVVHHLLCRRFKMRGLILDVSGNERRPLTSALVCQQRSDDNYTREAP